MPPGIDQHQGRGRRVLVVRAVSQANDQGQWQSRRICRMDVTQGTQPCDPATCDRIPYVQRTDAGLPAAQGW
ncbi:MAG: hypothetical protein J0M11_03665 [Anaerolineae bacterium]|nr:hypothetical protein [Anaerolineae bacterium]